MSNLSIKGLDNIRRSKLKDKNPNYIKGKEKYRTYKWLYQKYIIEDLSLNDLSKIVGVSLACIVKWMNKVNIERRVACNRSGNKSSRWKGGRTVTSKGYVYIHQPNHPRCCRRYVPEQILVAEIALGRYLNGDEIIHHLNEIKGDNRPTNLYLFASRKYHQRYHQKFRKHTIERITISNLTKSN